MNTGPCGLNPTAWPFPVWPEWKLPGEFIFVILVGIYIIVRNSSLVLIVCNKLDQYVKAHLI